MPEIKELEEEEEAQLMGGPDSDGRARGQGADAPSPAGDTSAEGMPAEAAEEGEEVGEGVRKVVLTPGQEGSVRPVMGATVFAHYRAWVRSTGSKIFDTWEEQQQLEMTLGSERRDLKGLSAGLRSMQRAERALLHVPYTMAYGEEGSFSFPSVPPKSDLVYEVVLNGFDNPKEGRKSANVTVEDRIASADRRRAAGNEHFREGRLEDALLEYDMALGYMGQDFMMQMFGKYRDMANAVRLPCLLNSAACQLKLNKFHEAIGLCSEVLAEDKDNAKALFRRGKARIALGQTEEAAEDLKRAQKLAPGDAAIKAALAEIRREAAQRREEEKRLFQGMFSSEPGAEGGGGPAKGKGKSPARRPLWTIVWEWIQRFIAGLLRLLGRPKRD